MAVGMPSPLFSEIPRTLEAVFCLPALSSSGVRYQIGGGRSGVRWSTKRLYICLGGRGWGRGGSSVLDGNMGKGVGSGRWKR